MPSGLRISAQRTPAPSPWSRPFSSLLRLSSPPHSFFLLRVRKDWNDFEDPVPQVPGCADEETEAEGPRALPQVSWRLWSRCEATIRPGL